jgi:C1A family cysteine protease
MDSFNWRQYLINNEDLLNSGIRSRQMATKHFVLFGRAEGRTDKADRKYPVIINTIDPDDIMPMSLAPASANVSSIPKVSKLPKSVDLRSKLNFPIYDQGNLGSCTANALCTAYQYLTKPYFMGSRLFLYYNERVNENSVNVDAGAYIRDGVKSLQLNGLCSEKSWPYNISQFAVKPPQSSYTEGLSHKVTGVRKINQTIESMQAELVNGYPFIVGIAVYKSFESANATNTGYIPMPKNNETILGGHAILICGYTSKGYWIFRNSWGSLWGDRGYGYLPKNYLVNRNLASDIWSITKTTN